MNITYSDFVSLYIEDLARRRYIQRLRKQRTACVRGMEVCDRIINDELANKSDYQNREMMLRKELSDMGEEP